MMILLAGMPGSGKEEFLNVARDYDYEVVRMGDVVRELADEEDVLMEGNSVGRFAHSERERFHFGIWAERTLSRISERRTVIDGVRSYEEVEIFKAELQEDLDIVAVHASPQTRFERLKEREREDSPETWEDFIERDERELDWGLGKIIAMADKMLVNEGSLSSFQKKVEEYFEGLE